MNTGKRRRPVCSGLIRVHQRFVKAIFPGKNPGKLLAGYLLLAYLWDIAKLIITDSGEAPAPAPQIDPANVQV
ncbi:MAG: hypothetical protein DRI57_16660 [Deltaproteobacteria bacterium]|nr:MAG: hypothetical protein DRI57_16660 [Deltaproteobacteria bacterium]